MKTKTLFGQYQIQKVIGQGGMGTVYLAKDINRDIMVAIKRVPIKKRDRQSILREPKILKMLDHPNIVKIFDIYEAGDSIFFVMEFINGFSLKDGLRKEREYSENQVIYWSVQLCDALSHLHNTEPYPIIYRDMKPSNILIDKNDKVTLIDFGIACELTYEALNEDKVALTRGFCAPEQYVENTFDNRSDVYSLGVTMYNLLTGITPSNNSFQLSPIRDVRSDISQEMEFIITKATMIDPSQRYQNIEDLKYDLLNIDKINTDLRNLVFRQIVTYFIFFLVYIISFSLIFLGGKKLKQESLDYSLHLITEGNNHLVSNNYQGAYDNFSKAIGLDEGSKEAYEGLYSYYFKTANYSMGINYIKPKLDGLNKINGLEEINNLYLSKYYYKIDNYREALKYAEAAHDINPDNTETIFYLALAYIENKDDANSELYIKTLIDLDYDEYKIYFLNAKYNIVKGNYIDGINFYAQIIDNSLDNILITDAYIGVAKLYKNNTDIWKDSESLFFLNLEEAENTLNDSNKSIELKLLKAESYKEKADQSTGENRELYLNLAIDNFHDILKLGRNEIDIYIKIAYLYRNLARNNDDVTIYDLAIQTLNDANIQHPDEFLPHYHLTTLQFEKEFFKDNDSERDFQVSFESFNKTKALAKTEADFELLIKLEDHINENVN